jgi:hypothetical protein
VEKLIGITITLEETMGDGTLKEKDKKETREETVDGTQKEKKKEINIMINLLRKKSNMTGLKEKNFMLILTLLLNL